MPKRDIDWLIRRKADAFRERKRRLAAFRDMVKKCDCTWPLDIYRNGDGHDPSCPAHTPMGA